MVYVGPAGPVWLVSAPVSVMAAEPVLRHVGATTTVSLGWYTRLPDVSTSRASGAAACAGIVVHELATDQLMSSTQTPTSETELSDPNRKRMVTSRPVKSFMLTRTFWKTRLSPAQARRPGSGLPNPVLSVAL